MGNSPRSGIYAPDQLEAALVALRMRQLRDSLEPMVFITAVNQAHQDSLVAEFAPDADRPMHVHRLDTGVMQWTVDGITWRLVDEGAPLVKYRLTTILGSNNGSPTTVSGFALVTGDSVASPQNFITANTTTESGVPAGGIFTVARGGTYEISARIGWSAHAGGGGRHGLLYVNGTAVNEEWQGAAASTPWWATVPYKGRFSVGAKIQVVGEQFSGATLNYAFSATQDFTTIDFKRLGA